MYSIRMPMKPIVIFGLGKIADVVYHHLTRDGGYEVVAFTCDAEWLHDRDPGSLHYGVPVVPFEQIEQHYPPESISMFVAVGYQDLNGLRARKYDAAKRKGYQLITYVSPRADHGPWLEIGDNCVVLDGVGIQPGAKIGNDVWLWNNALIGHHTSVADHCWVAAGATMGGASTLGARCFVGLNATIGGEVELGPDCFLGAAALVVKCAPAASVFIAAGTEKFRLDSATFLRMTRMPSLGSSKKTF